RLHIGNQLSQQLELRSRFDWGYVDDPVLNRRTGFVILQDIIYRPTNFPLSLTARYALFDTDGFQIRFYHFENNLLNTFAVPAYFNRGSRFYVNLRYRPFRNFTIEGRIAQTFWADRETIGSGLEEIDGQVQTQASAQIKYQF
ncbi:MAG: helix-hairpin-helix domain-containing protein, partial [Bacteroidota bacterium]